MASNFTPSDKAVLILPISNNKNKAVLLKSTTSYNNIGWSNSEGDTSIRCTDFKIDEETKPLYMNSFANADYAQDEPSPSKHAPTIMNLITACHGWVDICNNSFGYTADNFSWGNNLFFDELDVGCSVISLIILPMKNSAKISFKNTKMGSYTYSLDNIFWGIGHLETMDKFYEE